MENDNTIENEMDPVSGGPFFLELDSFDDRKNEDRLWQARTGLDYDTLCGAIETIVFMSERPVSLKKIKSMIDPDMPLRVIHESLGRLQLGYENKHHGIRLMEVADGYQFRTKASYSKYIKDLFRVNSLSLTPSALEVLAIVAYKQPISKGEIEKTRGVDSSHLIRALMEKRLIKINGRSEDLGRPSVYTTTIEFLEVFNIKDISELPPEYELETLSQANDLGAISDIKELVSGDSKKFYFDETDELDNLSQEIKKIPFETDFLKSINQEEKRVVSPEEAVDGPRKKTAFEILEEYINKKIITDQMKLASESTLPNPANIDPRIISDLSNGPFNVPKDDGEAFEMIDLDTGLEIKDEFDELFEEREILSDALDKALEGLSGIELSDLSEEEDEMANSLKEIEENLEDRIESVLKEAKDLDIDLDFLKN